MVTTPLPNPTHVVTNPRFIGSFEASRAQDPEACDGSRGGNPPC